MTSIQDVLSKITPIATTRDSFSAKASASSSTLPIQVKGFPYGGGKLKFPLSTRAAKALIKLARPAKFGKKEKTLLDKSVRDCWEISKSKISIDKRCWSLTLKPLLEDIRAQLNLPEGSSLKAILHNMLVYETGQFFNPHQDSEKLDDMIATLVVTLPSPHSGGSLVVEHNGKKSRFLSSRVPSDKLGFFAFYADCQHQVKPVTDGHRVALTYNLVLDKSKVPSGPLPLSKQQLNKLTKALEHEMVKDYELPSYQSYKAEGPRCLTYLLDHQYSQKSLGWSQLKNGDQARVDCLIKAAENLDLVPHLTLINIQELWNCTPNYDNYSYRSYRYRPNDSEDEGYTLEYIIDEYFNATYWLNKEGEKQSFCDYSLPELGLFWTKKTDDFDPYESEYEGFMGNYGNTLDRWYHRAAVTFWRKDEHFTMLCKLDINSAISQLCQLLKSDDTRAEATTTLEETLPIIVSNLKQSQGVVTVLELALLVKNDDVALTLLTPLGWSKCTASLANDFFELYKLYGEAWVEKLFDTWSNQKGYRNSYTVMDLKYLPKLAQKLTRITTSDDYLLSSIIRHQISITLANHSQSLTLSKHQLQSGQKDRVQSIIQLVSACYFADKKDQHATLMGYITLNIKLYSPSGLILIITHNKQLMNKEHFKTWGYSELISFLEKFILEALELSHRAPNDWSIKEISTCRCADCSELNTFLSSSVETKKTWPLAKRRRQHIHGTINGLGITVTHKTVHKGSPHQLILNKMAKLFTQHEQRVKNFNDSLVKLRNL